MENNFIEIKAAVAAFFTAIGAFLGWQGVMALVWVACMAIDYITGSIAAARKGEWSSAVARQGLWHKGGMIVVVAVAAIADVVMMVICDHLPIGISWTSIIFPLVLAWYIVTELGSILENAVKMGATVPEWLIKLMKIGLKAIDEAGEKIEGEAEAVLKDDSAVETAEPEQTEG